MSKKTPKTFQLQLWIAPLLQDIYKVTPGPEKYVLSQLERLRKAKVTDFVEFPMDSLNGEMVGYNRNFIHSYKVVQIK